MLRARHAIVPLAVLLSLSGGCRCDRDRPKPAATLPPLAASPLAALPVTGFGAAVVSAPVGAARPMPVVVAVLGIGDTPEEQCAAWRDVVGERAFVVCPRGAPNMVTEDAGADESPAQVPTLTAATAAATATATAPAVAATAAPDDEDLSPAPSAPSAASAPMPRAAPKAAAAPKQVGFYPVDLGSVTAEITASLAALKARHGAHVAEREVVYAGFSRGAFLGASLVAKYPDRFPRAVLIEGGQSPWQKAEATSSFARGGGRRILFVCGQPSCVEEAEGAASGLRAQKVEVRIAHGAGEGHGYKKQVKDELRRSFDWVVDGVAAWDPR